MNQSISIINEPAPGTRQQVIEALAAMLLAVMLDKDKASPEDHQQAT